MTSLSDGKKLTETHATSFARAALFLPEDKRALAYVLYGFCRTTDEIIDGPGTREVKEARLDEWKTHLERAWNGEPNAQPLLAEFVRVCRAKKISSEWGFRLIEGLRVDLNAPRVENFDELYAYCFSAAAIPGILIAHAMDAPPEAMEYAISLGIGMQLTNILRDIREDVGMGRYYLPRDEMNQFGYTDADLHSCRVTPEFRSLMQFNIARARAYYAHAENGIARLSPDVQLAMRLCLVFYREILAEIEEKGYDVFASRAFVPEARKNTLIAQEERAFSSRIQA